MIDIKIQGDTVIINDSLRILVDESEVQHPSDYYNEKYGTNPCGEIELDNDMTSDSKHDYYNEQLDPHYYQNGRNSLTIRDSAIRVLDRACKIFEEEDLYPEYWESMATEDVDLYCSIIAEGHGRDYLYRQLGGIKKGLDEGKYRGVLVNDLLKLAHEGRLLGETETT